MTARAGVFFIGKHQRKGGVIIDRYTQNKKAGNLLVLIVASLIIGGIVGSLDSLFGQVLLAVSGVQEQNVHYLLPFLAPAGMIFTYLFITYGKNASQGMTLVFRVGHEKESVIPKRLIPFVMVGTWLTHLFGGSAGREGVAVQLGATVSNWVGRYAGRGSQSSLFLATGMAAGFAGLFQTPIAAIFFALEVLVIGSFKYEALLSSTIAAFTASAVAGKLGLEAFTVALNSPVQLNGTTLLKLAVAGVVFGLTGLLFAASLNRTKQYLAARISHPVVRIGIIGVIASCLLFIMYQGRYSGLGTNLIDASFSAGTIYSYDWLLKLLLTVLTISAGFQGGEVTPLFSIGASLGMVLSQVVGLPPALTAAMGYAAVFGSATNTFLAPIFIGAEVFGFHYTPYFFIVCTAAYLCNMNKSIYPQQKQGIR